MPHFRVKLFIKFDINWSARWENYYVMESVHEYRIKFYQYREWSISFQDLISSINTVGSIHYYLNTFKINSFLILQEKI